MARRAVTVRVPGSTSNLGSGFDTLGLALDLHTTVGIKPIAGAGVVVAAGVGAPSGVAGNFALVSEAADLFFRVTKRRRFGFEASIGGDVPAGRGLGYSATVRVGVLAGLDAVSGARLGRERLLELAVKLEGHPDNASPAVFGGFTVSGMIPGGLRCLYFSVSAGLRLVTLIPRFGVSTTTARALLPSSYSQEDAAHALNRASLITAAFARQDWDSLRGVFDDRLHQPYRSRLIPQLSQVIRAGEKAGAVGGFLSGSGSSIICVTRTGAAKIGAAMRRRMPESEIRICAPDNDGFQIARA